MIGSFIVRRTCLIAAQFLCLYYNIRYTNAFTPQTPAYHTAATIHHPTNRLVTASSIHTHSITHSTIPKAISCGSTSISTSTSTSTSTSLHLSSTKEDTTHLQSICDTLNTALEKCQPEFIKTCKVKVGISPQNGDDERGGHRLGLIATESLSKESVALSIPYDDQWMITPDLALNTVWKGVLPDGYDGWTGDAGLIALVVLNELAKSASASGNATAGEAGIPQPKRKSQVTSVINAWIQALPSPSTLAMTHPLLWDEDDQEVLQSSSTRKVYRILDDLDEDANWLQERIWSKDRTKFPEQVTLNNGETYDCFTPQGFIWAYSIVSSRAVFVDGSLRLIPFMDMVNHDDVGTQEVNNGFMGTFGTTKGVELKTGKGRVYKAGEEVFSAYGPKSSAEYLLEHGFVPQAARSGRTSVAELTFEVDEKDRFYDDKLDILEFETYDSAPMEPLQSFDVVSEVGSDGEPDPALIQFLRLVKLGNMDAFLLESVFRKEVWGFMSMPVSEGNERDVLDTIANACSKALTEIDEIEKEIGDDNKEPAIGSPAELCLVVREAERKALSRTLEFVSREKEALDLKEYYQERRLKDLGLDSEWNAEESPGLGLDEYDEDGLSFGQTRMPGGGGLDW